jgi:hypothetical protein
MDSLDNIVNGIFDALIKNDKKVLKDLSDKLSAYMEFPRSDGKLTRSYAFNSDIYDHVEKISNLLDEYNKNKKCNLIETLHHYKHAGKYHTYTLLGSIKYSMLIDMIQSALK